MPQRIQNNSGSPRRCIWAVGFMLSGVILWISSENQFFLKCQWRFLTVKRKIFEIYSKCHSAFKTTLDEMQNFWNLFQMPQRLQNNSGWPRRCTWPVGFMLSGVILWICREKQFFYYKFQWCFLIVTLLTQSSRILFQMPERLQNYSVGHPRYILPVVFMYFVNLLRKPIFLKVPVTIFDSYTANANSGILFQKPERLNFFLLSCWNLFI